MIIVKNKHCLCGHSKVEIWAIIIGLYTLHRGQ